ncbi:MAG: c-type cytochrome [Acidimicrobiia bacterium]|nr:c-type cytochrome [Acidimicrobiia bacterium]
MFPKANTALRSAISKLPPIGPWLVVAIAVAWIGCHQRQSEPAALSPQDALTSFRLSDDFRIELFACEPYVLSPVEMVFDENGRIYVAEMLDYPEDPPPGKPARSRIRLLEDRDGDGRVDHAVVFADRVLEVSGLQPWKGGLIVTSAPDILFMKDTNGDGQADERRVLYTGFPKVNPEARITNPRLAIDNWVYASNTGSDGRITSPDQAGHAPVLVRGADFRFRPDRRTAEPASGPAQFGSTFDDWGNRFITQNTIHLRHVVLPMQYLDKSPFLDIPAVAQDISDHGRPSSPIFPLTSPQAWRVERTRLRQQRYDENRLNRTEQVGGYFSAASGSTIYSGDVFPKEYWGNIFTGEVNSNLVHRDILRQDGVSFLAARAKDGIEFLASTDPWFRPCNFTNAPDGNLYVTDIYRLFIETPESIPEELKKNMDFWAGDTMGRIYRIVSNKPLRRRDLKPQLGVATTVELVRLLESTNGWHRQTAQRLLLERQDPSAIPPLRELVQKSRSSLARIHALWSLEGLSALQAAQLGVALRDVDPHLREHALRLSEPWLDSSEALKRVVFDMARDSDMRVQFQLALTLGRTGDPQKLATLVELASLRPVDPWFRTAILSSVAESAHAFYEQLRSRSRTGVNPELLEQLGSVIGGKHDTAEMRRFLKALARESSPEAGLRGLARGLKLAAVRDLFVPEAQTYLSRFLNSSKEPVQAAAWEVARHLRLGDLTRKALAEALSEPLPLARRTFAIRALQGGSFEAVSSVLRTVLDSPSASILKLAAIDTLSVFDHPTVPSILMAPWKGYSPEARQRVLTVLLRRREWMAALVSALEDGNVERASVDATVQARLLDHPDPAVVDRARKVFSRQGEDRSGIVAAYRDVLKLRGDVAHGKQAFEKTCAKCHLPQGERARLGPDLSGISSKSKEELLKSILDPSASIEPRFVNYIVITKDGRMHDGILGNETPGALTLRGTSDEGDTTLLRRNIADIRASTISLMPDEIEKTLQRQGIADVIAYLQGGL